MDRLEQKKEDFFNAFERLKEALKEEPTELVVDGVLHRFEFTLDVYKRQDLYCVKAKITLFAKPEDKDEDEIDKTDTASFIVYKNKLIYSDFM